MKRGPEETNAWSRLKRQCPTVQLPPAQQFFYISVLGGHRKNWLNTQTCYSSAFHVQTRQELGFRKPGGGGWGGVVSKTPPFNTNPRRLQWVVLSDSGGQRTVIPEPNCSQHPPSIFTSLGPSEGLMKALEPPSKSTGVHRH